MQQGSCKCFAIDDIEQISIERTCMLMSMYYIITMLQEIIIAIH